MLTPNEYKIVKIMQENPGISNTEIANKMRLKRSTVKVYLTRIYDKIKCKNRTELTVWNGMWK